MIRIELHNEARPGIWAWSAPSHALSGLSRQPLLDACRELKSLGADTAQTVGAFREGRSEPDYTCQIGVGAGLTVEEPNRGKIHFRKFQEFRGLR